MTSNLLAIALIFHYLPLSKKLDDIPSMSSLIAVAGGTGNLGRTIVEAIVADGKFEVVILARKVRLIHLLVLIAVGPLADHSLIA